ncbi:MULTISPECIES: PIG-L deacetylase family protein [unclassified Streptomyces]|uniref:PIG-L deacetylase family protein n=1 Tax=unclassified Streptomyces TaxID=2593676 RepID=UPI002E27B3CE|nr:PIG-L deacetylase family protein [Streptomyces sp. NBC_00223]
MDEHVVAVVAHPDDAELLAYGTLRRYHHLGAEVTVLIATRGANGVSLTDAARGVRLTEGTRTREVEAAWDGTGVELAWLGLADSSLHSDRGLVSAVEGELVRLGCTTVITHSPHAGNDHQDHLALATATANAVTRVPSCRTVLYGEPHSPRSNFAPTVLVDITVFLDDKVKALARHKTQEGRWYLEENYTRHRAAAAGWRLRPTASAAGRAFEAFETPLLTLLNPPPEQERT